MQRSRQTGLIIMIVSAFTLVVFVWAMLKRSYMAVALPVMSALAVVSGLAFWIGWTLYAGEDEDEEDLEDEGVAEGA
jgi:lipopolysaccharide export LptBFGC system permease protein LptF